MTIGYGSYCLLVAEDNEMAKGKKQEQDGLMPDEQAKTYAEMEAKVQNYTKEIERMQQIAAMEQKLTKPTSVPLIINQMNEKKAPRTTNEYKEAMLTALCSNFKQVSNVLQEGGDTAGSYLVPEEYDSRLIQGMNEENIMRKLGTKITTSGEHKINIVETTLADSWIEEGGALSFVNTTFKQILLDVHKLHVAIKIT